MEKLMTSHLTSGEQAIGKIENLCAHFLMTSFHILREQREERGERRRRENGEERRQKRDCNTFV